MEKGAAWPGRWHSWQFRCSSGATSFAKVCAKISGAMPSPIPITHTSVVTRIALVSASIRGYHSRPGQIPYPGIGMRSNLDDAPLRCDHHRLCPVVHVQPAEDDVDVPLH